MSLSGSAIADPECLFLTVERGLIWRCFEDGHLVFDQTSGETVLVSHLAHFLWQQVLTAGAQSLSELADCVHAEEPGSSIDQCRAEVGETLDVLLAAGFLQTANCAS